MRLKSRLTMIVTGIAVFGFSLFGIHQISEQIQQAESDYQMSAHMKLGNAPRPVEGWAEYMAEYDYIAFSPSAWNNENMQEPKKEIQRLNLDCMLGTYIHAHTVSQWNKVAYERGQTGINADWWEFLSPLLAITTEQDTAAIFKANYVFDIFNPEARARAISIVDKYVIKNQLDWIMLDFVSVPLPNLKAHQNPKYEKMEHGDLDFNRDGIGHWDDPAERQELREVWDLYIDEMLAVYPNQLKLIPNGALAIKDPAFAKKVHGCYIEGFPQWFFGDSPWKNAFDPDYPNSLWKLTEKDRWLGGKGIVMLEDRYYRGTFGYIAKIFDGVVEMRREMGDDLFTDPGYVSLPIELDTGAPLGPPQFIGSDIIRKFVNGDITIHNADSNHPTYSYVITKEETPGKPETPKIK